MGRSPPAQFFRILIKFEHIVQQGPLGYKIDYRKLRRTLVTMMSERLGTSKKPPQTERHMRILS